MISPIERAASSGCGGIGGLVAAPVQGAASSGLGEIGWRVTAPVEGAAVGGLVEAGKGREPTAGRDVQVDRLAEGGPGQPRGIGLEIGEVRGNPGGIPVQGPGRLPLQPGARPLCGVLGPVAGPVDGPRGVRPGVGEVARKQGAIQTCGFQKGNHCDDEIGIPLFMSLLPTLPRQGNPVHVRRGASRVRALPHSPIGLAATTEANRAAKTRHAFIVTTTNKTVCNDFQERTVAHSEGHVSC